MSGISGLLLCGNKEQVERARQRVRPSIMSIETTNLVENINSFSVMDSYKDYCFVALDKEQADILMDCVSEHMVLHYYLFDNTSYDHPCQQFFQSPPDHITELMFGMSHSECGITDDYLVARHCLKFSLPSLDLFLQFKSFQKICSQYGNCFSDVKDVVIELPYYIFNYDLSRFGSFVLSKLNYFKYVGDYHHYGETPEQKGLIRQFELFIKLFTKEKVLGGKIVQQSIILRSFYFVSFVAKTQWQAIKNEDKVWTKVHEETIEENKTNWRLLINVVRKFCPQAKVKVMVMPFNPLFRWFHKSEILYMKGLFYDIMKMTPDIKVVDNFNMYCNMFLFEDHCHLNRRGAKKYTKSLKKMMIKNSNEHINRRK